jgi:uncharacterized protein
MDIVKEVIMNKKWLSVIILGLVLILVVPILSGCSSPVVAQGTPSGVQINQQPEGIWVSGTGEISITPDIATLNLGVMAQEASVSQAQSAASEAMSKVMKALTDAGIASKDIQTGYFSISQQTRWDDMKKMDVPMGFQVTNMVTVKIRAIDKVGDIIDAVVGAGEDLIRINGINFSVENPAQYYSEARQKAMDAAKTKASELAKLAGVNLGQPTYINENAQYTPYYGGYANFSVAVPAPSMGSVAPPISSGQTTVTISVQVAYSVTP